MATETDLQRLIIQMEARNARLEKDLGKSFKAADAAAKKIETRFNKMNKTVSSQAAVLGKGLVKSFGAIGLGIGLTQLPRTISDIIKNAADIGVLADRIGLSTDALQELRFAADLANVDIGDFDTSMAQFTKRLGEATTGAGDLAKIFALNNIPLQDAQGNLRPINDLLLDYADLIKNAANEQEAFFLATEAFGKSGGAMVSILGQGSEALLKIMGDAKETGKVLDESLIRKAQEMDDEWDAAVQNMTVAWKTFVIEVVGGSVTAVGAINSWGNKTNFWLNRVTEGFINLNDANQAVLTQGMSALASLPSVSTAAQRAGVSSGMSALTSKPSAVTKLPVKIDPEGKALADQAARDKKAVADLISELEHEYKLLGQSDTQKAISNALREAGSTATDTQKQKITQLVSAIEAEEAALEAAKAAQAAFAEETKTFIHEIVGAMDEGASFTDAFGDAVFSLGKRLRDIAIDAAIDKLLTTLLGGATGGSGGIGAILSGIFGKVQGGMASAGTPIEVGESGREVFVPTTPGRIIPNNQLGGDGSRNIVIELVEGGLLRPIIRQEAADISVKVSRSSIAANNRQQARQQALRG